ncbi:MAG: PH domain-containing protein, partial [Planctomycetota bacterium]|nr:PH domain-containing protein [Planctomycetota bacterium]
IDAKAVAELIQDDEVVILLLRPSLLSIPLTALGSLVFIALITFMLAWMTRLSWVGWSDWLAFGFGALLMVIRLGWQTLEWYSRLYILTDKRIIRRMGVLRVAVFETQLKNIQHTSVFQSLRERLFGLGSIGFATAGSDVFEAYWMMIDRPFAIHRVVVRAIEKYGG